ncbi:Hypothetical predicted protein [Marmota monax]|uniref:Uncharacterized protein n=1 Tax=Marmota monax TaxID=9995 RepID=A0A5E4BLL1_MARMO|nr:Hypothetical predicted protein [Marmota monax]
MAITFQSGSKTTQCPCDPRYQSRIWWEQSHPATVPSCGCSLRGATTGGAHKGLSWGLARWEPSRPLCPDLQPSGLPLCSTDEASQDRAVPLQPVPSVEPFSTTLGLVLYGLPNQAIV